ncbi:MAG: hypothetical protein KIT08_06425 [Anaerolineales bacterium]|nr:MAG: hypothetical protein KIT08_06425 [Anaerolineales bacterium]
MSTPHHDPEENLPDWLKALRQKQSEQAAEDAAAEADNAAESQANPESEPDWLADIRRRHSGEDDVESERALTDTQPNKPFRLESRRLEASALEDSEESEAEDALPDWLEPEADEFDEDEPEATPAFGDAAAAPTSDLPSWLQGPTDAEPVSSGAFYDNYENMEPLTPAEVENAGPLAGLSGVLPAEPEVAKIGKAPVFSTRLEVSEGQFRHAAMLQSLIANEGQPKADLAGDTRRPARLLNLLMAGAMLAAALAPLLGGQMRSPRPEPEALPGGTAMFNAIDVLPAAAPVLVVFDVQPALYGELRAAANPVISHLLDRQARLTFVSTQPTGPGLVERMLQSDFAQVPLVASKDYVSLGYLPGGMAAVRSFASNPRQATLSAPATFAQPWQRSSLQGIQGLDDFALVLLVVSEGEDARTWLEQATPELSKGLLVVSSAQAAPVLRAYLNMQPSQVEALVAGVSGGAHYERLRARDSLSVTYWDSYSYQLGAAVLIIVLGGLYGRLIHTPTEKKA